MNPTDPTPTPSSASAGNNGASLLPTAPVGSNGLGVGHSAARRHTSHPSPISSHALQSLQIFTGPAPSTPSSRPMSKRTSSVVALRKTQDVGASSEKRSRLLAAGPTVSAPPPPRYPCLYNSIVNSSDDRFGTPMNMLEGLYRRMIEGYLSLGNSQDALANVARLKQDFNEKAKLLADSPGNEVCFLRQVAKENDQPSEVLGVDDKALVNSIFWACDPTKMPLVGSILTNAYGRSEDLVVVLSEYYQFPLSQFGVRGFAEFGGRSAVDRIEWFGRMVRYMTGSRKIAEHGVGDLIRYSHIGGNQKYFLDTAERYGVPASTFTRPILNNSLTAAPMAVPNAANRDEATSTRTEQMSFRETGTLTGSYRFARYEPVGDADAVNLAHEFIFTHPACTLNAIRGAYPLELVIDNLGKVHGMQFHYSNRWVMVLNENHLLPIAHSLSYKLSFWGRCEEEQRENIADFIKAMFFSQTDGVVDNSPSSETSCIFPPALKARFTRTLSTNH